MPDEELIEIEEPEKVEGQVEGLTYSESETKMREESRQKWLVDANLKGFGKNQLSEAVGMVFLSRQRNRRVRETSFSCGAELAGAIDAYWCFVMDLAEMGHTTVPDVEQLASFLGVTRNTLKRWQRGEDNIEFVDVVNIAFNDIASVQKQLGMQGKLSPIMIMASLNNDHGYIQNQKSSDVQINVRLKDALPDRNQLTQIIERLP